MRRHLLLSAAGTAGLLCAPFLVGTAAAAPPMPTSGAYTAVLTGGTSPAGPGNAAFFEFSNAITLTGTLTGTGTATYRCVQVGMEFIRCHGEQVVDAVVAGVGEGTLTNRVVLTCSFTTGRCSAITVSIAGTDGLENVHAVTRSESIFGAAGGTYSGKLVVPGR